jgi:trk system potassium uptake protein TrkA
MKKQIAVLGLGRFGASVARTLYNLGHDVLAIDKDEYRVQTIMGTSTYALTGDCTNDTVLKELGIPDYDAAVVAIGSDVVSSIMTCVLLKTMGVPYVVARAHNELHGNTLDRIGVDKVIHAEEEMGNRLAHNMFNPNVEEYLEITSTFGISKLRVPDRFVGMSLKELGFSSPRDKYGLAVLALRRGRDITLNPDTDDRLRGGDWLVLAGRDELLDQLDHSAPEPVVVASVGVS